LDFITVFNLFFVRQSQSHDLDYRFNKLTQLTRVFFSFYLIDFFQYHHSILGSLRIMIHYLFWFAFYKVMSFHDSGHRSSKLTRVDSSQFLCPFYNWVFFSIASFNTRSWVLLVSLSWIGLFFFIWIFEFFFQFHSLIISLLEINFYNLFWFAIYEFIMVSWTDMRIAG